jgi:limonene-1,2-epoxide hydrolase
MTKTEFQRNHGITLIKVQDGRITHWREYQHIDGRGWEDFVGATLF